MLLFETSPFRIFAAIELIDADYLCGNLFCVSLDPVWHVLLIVLHAIFQCVLS